VLALAQLREEFNDRARERATIYDQRDHERDQQLQALGANLTANHQAILAVENRVLDSLKRVHDRLDGLVDDHQDIERRLDAVEQCKADVERHILSTTEDHKIVGSLRAWRNGALWFAGALIGLATIIGGFLPFLERIWPKSD
jgi:DNA repair exonuclease SbcCD ATPase subunit